VGVIVKHRVNGSSATQRALRRLWLVSAAFLALSTEALGADTDYHIRLLRDGTELEMVGEVSREAAAEIATMLAQNPKITVLQLTSEGGEMDAAFRLVSQVHDRALTTYVPSMCVSACTLVFLSGRERYVSPEAKLGFHQAIYVPSTTTAKLPDASGPNAVMKKWMLGQGVSPDFVDHAMATPHESVWIPTTDQLLKAHVVTAVTNGARFADPSFGRDSPNMVDQTLLNSPMLRAMQKADPGNYERMRNELFQRVKAGALDAESQAMNEVHFQLAFKQAALVAGDDAILAVMQADTAVLEMLNIADPAYCIATAMGRPIPEGHKGPMMPIDLEKRRTTAMAAVFESSMAKPQPAPTFEEARQIMENLVREMYRTYGDEWDFLRHPDVDPQRSCAMHIAIRKRMASIDLPDRSVLLRAMLGGRL
jgi:hypothetical protein